MRLRVVTTRFLARVIDDISSGCALDYKRDLKMLSLMYFLNLYSALNH